MLRRAAAFIVCNGPVTQQDRWEEDAGYSPFTLAVEISALVEAAQLARINGDETAALYLLETADAWYGCIDRWIYARGTQLARQMGVEGYYVRIAPLDQAEAASLNAGYVPIKNRPPGESKQPACAIVSPDALALVRFGLRAADDPRIVNTIRVIDALLKVEMPHGPCWHRYNDDGYGEHADGSPFDGTGIGRAWTLLTGERAHYELAAGRIEEAQRLCRAMESFANDGGLLCEQLWDCADIPERGLFRGRPSGSAMPLVWAHAEYVKLRRSLLENRVFDMPQHAAQRYLRDNVRSPRIAWRFNNKLRSIPAGTSLRIETLAPAVVRWSCDGAAETGDVQTRNSTLGIHYADLPSAGLRSGAMLDVTLCWAPASCRESSHFMVAIQ
jgi:glucoamylase